MTTEEIIESIDYCLSCDNDTIPTTQKDLRHIKDALEKQAPQKPIERIFDDFEGGMYSEYFCPDCNEYVNSNDGHCCECGKALDWGDAV